MEVRRDAEILARAETEPSLFAIVVDRHVPTIHRRVLRELSDEGDCPEVLEQYVDAIASGAPVTGVKTFSVEESYEAALGCPAHSAFRDTSDRSRTYPQGAK